MIDRTPTFRVLAPCAPRAQAPGSFAQMTARLNYEISAIEAQVQSENVLAFSDVLQQRFVELEQALAMLQPSENPSSQVLKHKDRVKAALEQRLKDAAKIFKRALEIRAQTLSSRQERHESLFGQTKRYAYKSAPPPPVASMRRRGQPLLRETYHEEEQSSRQHDQTQERKSAAEARSVEALRVEKTINEVGQLFLRVAGLVQEQGETLNDLEANLDDTVTQANDAQSQLLKLFRFVSGDRQLIVMILVSVTVIGCVIIYFLT